MEATRLLAQGLSERAEYDVEVVTLVTRHMMNDVQVWPSIPIHAFRYFGPARYGFSPGMLWFLMRCRADLLHVHGLWMFHCFAALVWHLIWRRPYVVTPHGMLEPWILARSTRLKRAVSGLYQNFFLKRAAAIQVLTEKEAGDAREFGLSGRVPVVIPNFVVAEPCYERPVWWLEEMRDKRLLMFFGRIHDKKGWRELCEAWDMACRASLSFASMNCLVFCGWIDQADGFEGAIDVLKARYGNVWYVGSQFHKERSRSLCSASVFVLPSKSEGLPMGVLEAWSLGVPCILTAECNLSIGFDEGAAMACGLDAGDICLALQRAASMPAEELSVMSNNAKRIASSYYGERAVMDKFVHLYEKSISG